MKGFLLGIFAFLSFVFLFRITRGLSSITFTEIVALLENSNIDFGDNWQLIVDAFNRVIDSCKGYSIVVAPDSGSGIVDFVKGIYYAIVQTFYLLRSIAVLIQSVLPCLVYSLGDVISVFTLVGSLLFY